MLKTYNEKRTKISVKTVTLSGYHASMIGALIAYGESVHAFKQEFKTLILKNINPKESTQAENHFKSSEIILPSSKINAFSRALWLVKNKELIPEEVQSALYSWAIAGEQSAPQQIVVGFVGVAIPGPTLGEISKKKKITMIMKKQAKKPSTAELNEKIMALGLDIVSQSVAMAGGEMVNIEPDVSAWFFGERGLELYSAKENDFSRIKQEVKEVNLINSIAEYKGDELIMAISPSLNKDHLSSSWKMDIVK
ncbi:MAG: hypothetical protein U9Q85_00310 [Patescibacteria group bacterium]|nr:hypothetical protein [Patescibacteria group bacterium]